MLFLSRTKLAKAQSVHTNASQKNGRPSAQYFRKTGKLVKVLLGALAALPRSEALELGLAKYYILAPGINNTRNELAISINSQMQQEGLINIYAYPQPEYDLNSEDLLAPYNSALLDRFLEALNNRQEDATSRLFGFPTANCQNDFEHDSKTFLEVEIIGLSSEQIVTCDQLLTVLQTPFADLEHKLDNPNPQNMLIIVLPIACVCIAFLVCMSGVFCYIDSKRSKISAREATNLENMQSPTDYCNSFPSIEVEEVARPIPTSITSARNYVSGPTQTAVSDFSSYNLIQFRRNYEYPLTTSVDLDGAAIVNRVVSP